MADFIVMLSTPMERNMLGERSMLGERLKDKIRNDDVRSNTKVTNVLTRVDQLKWKWTGHLLRSSPEKWSKRATVWYPRDGKRKRGRQIKRWEDEFRLILEPLWTSNYLIVESKMYIFICFG